MSVKGSETPPIIENKRIHGSYQDDDILVISMEDMVTPKVAIASAYFHNSSTTITGTVNYEPSVEMKAFKCPSCGGNSYSYKDGKIVCDYCGTMFTR